MVVISLGPYARRVPQRKWKRAGAPRFIPNAAVLLHPRSLAGTYRLACPVQCGTTPRRPDPTLPSLVPISLRVLRRARRQTSPRKKRSCRPPPAPHRRLCVSQKRSQSCFSFVPLVFFGQLCRWFSRLSLITFPELFLLCSPRFLRVVVGPAAFCTRAHEASSGKRGTYTPFFRWVGGCVAGWLGSGFLFWVEGWWGAGRWGLVCV